MSSNPRRRRIALVLTLVVVAAAAGWWWMNDPASTPRDDEARWSLTPVFDGARFDRPLDLVFLPDGDALVVEQRGRILRLSSGAEPTPFLDISERVSRDNNEEGLLGLALHPRFDENGRFFVKYSAAVADQSEPRRSVLSEFLAGPQGGDATRERVVLEVPQPYGNHNGGAIRFGPDGMLYVSLGDGGSGGDPQGHGQNRSTLLGSILRIDVDGRSEGKAYRVPDDNPFVNTPDARPEIWAYGLRNVWRMSFDRQTGALWAGDVGQNAVEEIDVIERGHNYGWAYREGDRRYASARAPDDLTLTEPVHVYSHGLGRSVTGGVVVRGEVHPELEGRYVFADFVTGRAWALTPESAAVEQLLPASDVFPSSLALGPNGRVYVTSFDGRIYTLAAR